jgi:hypothetical protein
MTTVAQPDTPLSTRMAENLLRAWESGDSAQVERELQRSLSISTDSEDVCEEERRHLLFAVAMRLKTHPDVSKSGDPVLDLCAKLLEHLASPE